MYQSKKAWLIGIYTIEMEERIASLGYKLAANFADHDSIKVDGDTPGLVVIAEDSINEPASYKVIKELLPDVLLISISSVAYNAMNPDFVPSTKQSVARLINHIHERVHRWDN